MKWQIDYVEDQGIVKAKTTGQMRWEDEKKLGEEVLAAGRENNVNTFLVDKKDASLNLSVLEIDRMPEMFRNLGFDFKDKMAILVRPELMNNSLIKFLRNVCFLNSLQIQVFTDPAEATAWLKGKNLKSR